jgi:Spy/CpxP family protein refolding chaperone
MTFTGRVGTALLVALIVSLCVNLLLAGMMVGGRWHGGHGGYRGFWTSVPEEARPLMKEVFDSHRTEFDARRDKVRQARKKVAEILKADTIDQAQLDQALSELVQQSQAMREFGYGVMIEVAKKLPPEQRREMAERWAKDRFYGRSGPQ